MKVASSLWIRNEKRGPGENSGKVSSVPPSVALLLLQDFGARGHKISNREAGKRDNKVIYFGHDLLEKYGQGLKACLKFYLMHIKIFEIE